MRVELTEPQSEIYESQAKYVAGVAGFGSGKTQVALTRVISNLFERPGNHQGYYAPTYPLIRDIWYPKVEEALEELGLKFAIDQQKHVIHIQGLGKIFCRTMEKPGRIVGYEIADAVLDEFDILPTDKALEVIRKVNARCRIRRSDGRKNQIMVVTTPEGFKATYKLFKKDPMENSHLVQMSTYSNSANLPPDYIDDLRSQYPSQLIDAYLEGRFVNLQSGTVYYAFDREKHNTHYVPKPREILHIGMDFNVTDMCAVVHIERADEDGVVRDFAVGELYGLRDTPDMCDAIKEKYPEHKVIVYPDASGKGTTSKSASMSDIKILKAAGFTVKAKNKNPLIKDRVASMNRCFESGQYFVNIEQCPEYTECLEQQPYNEVTGQPLKDGYLDNRVDGPGYRIYYKHPVVKPILKQKALGGF